MHFLLRLLQIVGFELCVLTLVYGFGCLTMWDYKWPLDIPTWNSHDRGFLIPMVFIAHIITGIVVAILYGLFTE